MWIQYVIATLASSELSSFASRVWGGLQSAVGVSKTVRADDRQRSGRLNNENESGDSTDRSLKVLAEFVERIAEKKVDGIIKEYRRLDKFFDTTATYEAFKANMAKNRYSGKAFPFFLLPDKCQ
ncbi:hypothetical protein OESDEN_20011 [Oesophagostomum dentatum]|uniref:Uncharacterized protein n=1 Tax=Oesophagostomum dentatum TaxID=61180 RepID=A0A0B1SAR4_OESDE|nr:hypothetical protein OESDEN_20011 [Oesophagostomum dentatum]